MEAEEDKRQFTCPVFFYKPGDREHAKKIKVEVVISCRYDLAKAKKEIWTTSCTDISLIKNVRKKLLAGCGIGLFFGRDAGWDVFSRRDAGFSTPRPGP